MTLLTISRVTCILCYFRYVLEGRTAIQSRLEFSEKILTNSFALSDTDNNNSGQLVRGDLADLLLVRTLLAILKNCNSQVSWE